jgi:AcrR family transcriptional regulator
MTTPRKRRANGEESRRKILAAAAEIAGERGYDGTSISAVSERSGLPASSIYWHFANKDELIAAVIRDSFERWRSLMSAELDRDRDDSSDPRTQLTDSMRQNGRAVVEAPDFLRLGLMLTLERRPKEPAARTLFLGVRDEARSAAQALYQRIFGDTLTETDTATLALMAVAATDGLFIAREVDGDALDTDLAFELIGVALNAVAEHLQSRRAPSTPRRPQRTNG